MLNVFLTLGSMYFVAEIVLIVNRLFEKQEIKKMIVNTIECNCEECALDD